MTLTTSDLIYMIVQQGIDKTVWNLLELGLFEVAEYYMRERYKTDMKLHIKELT